MTKNLVIVESPTKAHTIQTFLGKNYYVVSSYGHIIDLPEKKIGIQIKENFKPSYVILPKKKKLFKIKKLIKDHEIIWLASDEDREGEAIAYQICKIFNISEKKYKRIVFHEITKKAILNAIKKPRPINYNLVYAQQTRRIIDRLVGFQLSPILWKKINKGLSAGRVQSVAVRLIVEQEKKIQNFIPHKVYQIYGKFTNSEQKITFDAKLEKQIENKKIVKNILTLCINSIFIIKKIITKKKKKVLQLHLLLRLYNKKLITNYYSISQTMLLAQKLYEKGFITYLRTDSTNLSKSILLDIKNFILSLYGKKYLSIKKFSKNKKELSQEAHEAIRPTTINYNENYLRSLNIFEKRLYRLIWERTIIGQMTDVIFEKKNIYIQSSYLENFFISTKKNILFDGFMKISNKNKENKLNHFLIKEGTFLEKKEIIAKQITQNHLYRYTEASLVKKLEQLKIGRPSTYVPIIYTIKKRNYVNIQKISKKIETRETFFLKGNLISQKYDEIFEIEKNKFHPTEIGILTTNFLIKNFDEIMNFNFTADLEKNFDNIAKGKQSWIKIIEDFYSGFHKKLEHVKNNVDRIHKERFLGKDPKSKRKIFAKIAKYGPVIQMGEFNNKEKPKFSPLLNKQKIEEISFAEALKIIELPKSLGVFEEKEILLKINKFNIYIKHNNKSIPIDEKIFFNNLLNLKQAINIIIKNRKKIEPK
ncbi:DNA topoisomerase 1 [Blattabacterium sp. (Nauphoeta cinerea)]|uniref:type I DNA topoisomerase n=1 Tax=Blattabacterium sp. (Nauphoeta cinerea) TaxID=1316444 RepID=UPI0003B05048|nr:type I DNA topoisomerase [Blattabacterium sp. (Nauphoeta cinerea)]AGW86062.1 DNA topoisomerase 1 [Blattabacterium sp. (Nauphoeta cinerea)]